MEKASHRDVHNPLRNTSTNSLTDYATVFVDQHGLSEYRSVFDHATVLAQIPTNFESTAGLDNEELQALRDEENHKWRLPRSMWTTMIVCSIGAAVQGWDQTGSNGANLSFPAEFGIGSNSAHDKLLVGLINSVPPLAMICLQVAPWLTFLTLAHLSETEDVGFPSR
ncbi:hypothetical protein PRZ48_006757 [Zasmidium cellare]|uniref:Uncharacterized protein n=1 Tax=Zasmidium cellare TaxID=395010 RepID=A0ABR0EI83_ZASCE|nr:hypothetical protein PRZ48_006757 [Zasmidium cellare]